jgi:ribosomal protein S18 acetylase RimI-like enzyme
MNPIIIRRLLNHELPVAARLLSRAMCDNPIDVRAFGGEASRRRRRLERFYSPVLHGLYRRGQILGGFRDAEMIAVCAFAPPGHCQATLAEKVRILPSVVLANQIGTAGRIVQWVGAWSRRDPSQPHWHLGPVAVEPALQGQGVGRALMADFCTRMDECAGRAYLETDKHENVHFYRRFGFSVVAEAEVLRVRNWFMSRVPSDMPQSVGPLPGRE